MNYALLTLFRAPIAPFRNLHPRQPADLLYASRPAAVADGDVSTFYDDWYVPRTLGELQHLFEPGPVLLHVDKFSLVSEGLTSLDRIRSTLLPINDDLACHVRPPLMKGKFDNYILSFYKCKSKLFTIESAPS